ncbi:MAG: glycosyltransferase [Niabella sp.]|nr:glycosyltransferase [Niabella sp.]
MNKNVLYLSYDGMTDPLGQSQVLPYLTGLCARGFNISLISFEKKEKFTVGKQVVENICDAAGIKWYPQQYTRSPQVLSTIKDLRTMRKVAKELHLLAPFNFVHCRSYIAAMTGLWMKEKFDLPFIFDMRGFWADERVDGGIWNLRNPLFNIVYKFFKKKEKAFLNQAAAVISLTENARMEIGSWPGVRPDINITVIPCCVDLDLFDPEAIQPSDVALKKEEMGLSDSQKIITYIGSVGTWYLLDEMLMFFKQWRLYNPSSVFVFVTADEPNLIFERAALMGISSDQLRIKAAKRREVPLYIALGDYSLFFIKPAYSKKASSPTKQGEIMAMGKPVICNTGVGDTDTVVKEYQSGYLVHKFDPESFIAVIREMQGSEPDATLIRQGAYAFFALERGLEQYNKVYNDVLDNSSHS